MPETSDESVDTEAILREAAKKLRDKLVSLNGVKEIARISGALAQVCGELRQHAKGRHRALSQFSVAEIVAHLRSLPKADQDQAFTIAFGADDSEPLL